VAVRSRARGAALDSVCVALALVLALGLFWATERRIVGAVGLSSFPLDDSWIHLHFARNLAEGHGFAYNPGVPVAGSTAPLWTLLLAAAFALLGSDPAWAKVLGIGAALGTALLIPRLVRLWTESRALALVGGILAAISGPLVWGALSGMEVSLAALLVTAALVAHATRREGATALVLGLGVLARPEVLLLVPLLWLAGPITRRRTTIFAAVVSTLLVPWVLFNLATAGTPLPATASAKIEGGLIGFLSGTREPLSVTLVQRPWHFEVEWVRWLASVDVLLPALVLVGLWALWLARGREAALPASALLLHPIGMALLAPYRGPGFQEGRYSIHLLPLAIAVALVGIKTLSPPGRGQDEGTWRRLLRPILAGALLAAALWALPSAATRYAWAVQNIDAMQVHLGRWVAAHTPREARLALNDVGAIAYISRREVVDVMGLVTPAIVPYRQRGEAGVLSYLERACPDYLVIFPAWFPVLSAMTERFTPIYRTRLAHNTVAGADEMVVYETPWNRWRGAGARCAEGARNAVGPGR
jgi:hypothetical protein